MILHVDKARSKAIDNQNGNTGDVPFELLMEAYTKLEAIGWHNVDSVRNTEVPLISWNRISDMEGNKIQIMGWVKLTFDETKHRNGESSYGIGAITDGQLKLEVRIASFGNSNIHRIEKGRPVKVTGSIRFGSYLYLQATSGSDIDSLEGEQTMDTENMYNVTQMPEKIARHG